MAGALLTLYVTGVVQQLLPPEIIADFLRGGDPMAARIVSETPVDFAATETLDAATLSPMAGLNGWSQELRSGRLTPAARDVVYMELRGVQSRTVDIRSMRVRCLSRRPPPAGTLVVGPGPQGGASSVNLDARVDSPGQPITDHVSGQPYFATHDITVAKGEAVAVTFVATASRYSCSWDLSLTYDDGSRTGTMEVDRQGVVHGGQSTHPFSLTALAPRASDYRAIYDWRDFGTPVAVSAAQTCSTFAQQSPGEAYWCGG